MPQDAEPVCWICREKKGTTREHLIKKSDLKALFESDGRNGPYFYSDAYRVNQIVQGLKSNTLKSPVLICSDCNGARTQPHDFAWEWMSNWLRINRRRHLRLGSVVRPNRIFPYNTQKQMLNVHLYFLKLFGGLVREAAGKIPIDIGPFAEAIIKEQPHREVYLQFGIGDGTVGRSSCLCFKSEDDKSLKAIWIHRVGPIAVNVLFLQDGVDWDNVDTVWHPNRNRAARHLEIVDTRSDLDRQHTTDSE